MSSDIDSGNENVANGDASVLSGNQLLECTVLEMKLTNAKVVRGNDGEQNKTNDNQESPPELKKNIKHINEWKHSDLLDLDDFKWNLSISALDSHKPPSSLFEKFLTDNILQFICNESVRHAQSKEKIPTSLSCMI